MYLNVAFGTNLYQLCFVFYQSLFILNRKQNIMKTTQFIQNIRFNTFVDVNSSYTSSFFSVCSLGRSFRFTFNTSRMTSSRGLSQLFDFSFLQFRIRTSLHYRTFRIRFSTDVRNLCLAGLPLNMEERRILHSWSSSSSSRWSATKYSYSKSPVSRYDIILTFSVLNHDKKLLVFTLGTQRLSFIIKTRISFSPRVALIW